MLWRPHVINWKQLCKPPKPPKPPRRTWKQQEEDNLRPIHKVSWAWRWPTFGPFILLGWGEALYYRHRWYSGKIKDVAEMVAELPDNPEYHGTYRELLRRHAAGEPELQGENAELHLRRMAEIVAEATP